METHRLNFDDIHFFYDNKSQSLCIYHQEVKIAEATKEYLVSNLEIIFKNHEITGMI